MKIMWARVRGKTENVLFDMPFQDAYMFRPAYIQPIKSKVTNSETLGKALIRAAANGYNKPILESCDINKIGEG
ncbi:MAG: hypothetical protein ABUK01_06755 [Leptospirales bacterium]